MRLKRVEPIIEDPYGVCLWRMHDGSYLGDEDGRFLSMSGNLDNPIIEEKMRIAAISYIGEEAMLGGPLWMPGIRKISDSEADDQMENLLEGRIPDVVDSMKQAAKGGLL
jgi:hypothetical protein